MQYVAVGALLGLVLVILVIVVRLAKGLVIGWQLVVEATQDALLLGSAIVSGSVTGLLVVSLARHGGQIENNLPPGATQEFIIGILIVGMTATLAFTLANFWKHLR